MLRFYLDVAFREEFSSEFLDIPNIKANFSLKEISKEKDIVKIENRMFS